LSLVAVALFVQPKIEDKSTRFGGADMAAQDFLERALKINKLAEVAKEFGKAITEARGARRVLMITPTPDGDISVLTCAGPTLNVEIGDPSAAFAWVGGYSANFNRGDVEAEVKNTGGEGPTVFLELFELLQCDLALPLTHRGLLLGLALVKDQPENHELEVHYELYRSLRAYATVALANTFLHREATGSSHLKGQFDLANAMQESLMPNERPVERAGFQLAGSFRPMAECGGDMWSWRELGNGKVLLVMADATGHGAAPALLSAVAKGAIDAEWQMSLSNLNPGHLLTVLNRAVFRTGRNRYNMTAFAVVVDIDEKVMYYANAGHNFPLLIHGDVQGKRRVEPLIARGNTLGSYPENKFKVVSHSLSETDRLVLYTDGVVDVGAPDKEPWGDKRFRTLLSKLHDRPAKDLPALIWGELEKYLGDIPLVDDVTMLTFQLVPPEEDDFGEDSGSKSGTKSGSRPGTKTGGGSGGGEFFDIEDEQDLEDEEKES